MFEEGVRSICWSIQAVMVSPSASLKLRRTLSSLRKVSTPNRPARTPSPLRAVM